MTFKEIYIQTISFWPLEVGISDGSLVDSDSGKFPELTRYWEKAEFQTESQSDFKKIMVWAIYCAFHKKATKNFQKGKSKVLLEELNMEYLKTKFEESLLDEEIDHYADLRTEYQSN